MIEILKSVTDVFAFFFLEIFPQWINAKLDTIGELFDAIDNTKKIIGAITIATSLFLWWLRTRD